MKLKVVEKEDPDLNRAPDKVFADMTFGPYETDALFKKVKENFKSTEEMTMSEIPEFIDLSFLYEMNIKDIIKKYDNKKYIDENSEIMSYFDFDNNALIVEINKVKIEFRFEFYNIKIGNEIFLNLTYEKLLPVKNKISIDEYLLLLKIISFLK